MKCKPAYTYQVNGLEDASVNRPTRKRRTKLAWKFCELPEHEQRYLRQPDIHLFCDLPKPSGKIGIMDFPDTYEEIAKIYEERFLRHRN